VVLRGGLEAERKEVIGGWRRNCIASGFVVLLFGDHWCQEIKSKTHWGYIKSIIFFVETPEVWEREALIWG
jgi:hypothetical protein